MVRQFHTNSDYLTHYHFLSFALLTVANALMAWLLPWSPTQALWFLPAILLLTSSDIQVVMAAFALSVGACFWQGQIDVVTAVAVSVIGLGISPTLSALLHCVSHNSLRPRWLNRPVGEFIGMVQLAGFPDWTIIHVIHHVHTDDPERDPHPPGEKSYWEFTKDMRKSILSAYLKFYFEKFGQTPQTVKSVKKFALAMKADSFMRICFWYLLLGPQLFTFLFTLPLVFKMFHTAWFNYATHRPAGLKNLNDHFYKILNPLTFGLYFHENHHKMPNLFDPRKKPSPAKNFKSEQEQKIAS